MCKCHNDAGPIVKICSQWHSVNGATACYIEPRDFWVYGVDAQMLLLDFYRFPQLILHLPPHHVYGDRSISSNIWQAKVQMMRRGLCSHRLPIQTTRIHRAKHPTLCSSLSSLSQVTLTLKSCLQHESCCIFLLNSPGVFLVNADTSLVVATYPTIASEFKNLTQGPWMLTGYTLGFSVALPAVSVYLSPSSSGLR